MKSLMKEKIDEIAKCIFEETQNKKISSFGIYEGSFGHLLFLLYYSKYCHNKKCISLVEKYAERLLVQFVEKEGNFNFCYGLAGELYLLIFLREQNIIDLDIGNAQSILENYLLNQMKQNIQYKYFDFMHGALGIGLYFLKRGAKTENILGLIEYLYNTAEKNVDNTIFKWESNLIFGKNISGYSLSMSHGMSSIIIFLSRVIKSKLSNEKIQTMLAGAVNYILLQELDFLQFGFCFPNYILDKSIKSANKTRLGWCYGDLGVGIALWRAGTVTKNNDWQEKGVEILYKSVRRRKLEDHFVVDPGICHGSAGVAMIFRRMYLETQKDEFKKASHFWLSQTLNFSHFEDGLAGYKSFINNAWKCDYSFLTGISGIGLVLMSHLIEDQQNWDELLLLS